MKHVGLSLIGVLVGCASAGTHAGSEFPRGHPPQWSYGAGRLQQAGHVRLVSSAPVYVALLQLRPTLDSLDVRLLPGKEGHESIMGNEELVINAETVEAMPASNVSAQFGNCTIMTNAAGQSAEFCPVSRAYNGERRATWYFRNDHFLLLSDRPLHLPSTIPWQAQRTALPLAPGSVWTVVRL